MVQFFENIFKAAHRDVIEGDGSYVLREPAGAYALKFAGANGALRSQNTFFRNEIVNEATNSLVQSEIPVKL
jgi:hypothetical protein